MPQQNYLDQFDMIEELIPTEQWTTQTVKKATHTSMTRHNYYLVIPAIGILFILELGIVYTVVHRTNLSDYRVVANEILISTDHSKF